MATYYEIFGQKVQYLSSDPSPVAQGQVWYNSTTNVAKFEGYASEAWASGGNLPAAKYTNAGAGTQTAGLDWGGVTPTTSATNEYNGISWRS